MGSSIIPGHAKREEEKEEEFGFFGSLTSSLRFFLLLFLFFSFSFLSFFFFNLVFDTRVV